MYFAIGGDIETLNSHMLLLEKGKSQNGQISFENEQPSKTKSLQSVKSKIEGPSIKENILQWANPKISEAKLDFESGHVLK